jgi:uncharacterized membrane protein
MIRSIAPGRFIFAVAIAAFAILALGHAVAPAFPPLTAPWPATGQLSAADPNPAMPGGVAGAIFLGVLLLALALGLAIDRWTPPAALALAGAALLTALIAWLPRLIKTPSIAILYGPASELLAIAGAALVLAALLAPADRIATAGHSPGAATLLRSGRLLYVASLLVFGALHFIYAASFATLIPAWIPLHRFWIYFFGVAFFAAAVSLVTGIAARLAAPLLGLMCFLWVVTLHIPRCLAQPDSGDEWTSMLVALACGAGAWILAAAATAGASLRSRGQGI